MTDHDFGFRTDFYTFSPETLSQELPDFRILREVGKGSMGIVYEAERRSDGARVALKVLPPSLTLTDRALARFEKEGEVMSRIEHPAIVRVFEHGQKARLHYFAMEFVDGRTLEERAHIGPLPARKAAEICVEIAQALQYAHDHGVIHRDIKPGNIILTDSGRVAITDFGLARETGTGSFTESGAIVGTPMYMAPEQILGHRSDVDSRADVYGLGATLFELVTGQPPFTAPTVQGVLKAVLDTDPPNPISLRHDLPKALAAIILHALEKRPTHRYGSAQEMADDLELFLNGERVSVRLPNLPRRVLRSAQRHPWMAALVVLVIALSIGALALDRERQRSHIQGMLELAELQYLKATARNVDEFRDLTPTMRAELLVQSAQNASVVIEADPTSQRALLTRARVHHRQGMWRPALEDFNRAAALLSASENRRTNQQADARKDILIGRILTLSHLHDTTAQQQLYQDLMDLLSCDRSTQTLCVVAENLLDLAAVRQVDDSDRQSILTRASQILDEVSEPDGRTAIARAQLLQLQGRTKECFDATTAACEDFAGTVMVHDRAARIFRGLGRLETAERQATMARLIRDEGVDENRDALEQTPPLVRPWDTAGMRGLVEGLGKLLGESTEPAETAPAETAPAETAPDKTAPDKTAPDKPPGRDAPRP